MPGLLYFDQPTYLLLAGLAPLVILLSWRSLAGLEAVRRAFAIVARCAFILMLAIALAGPNWSRETDDQTAVFLVDQSASISRDRQKSELEFIETAVQTMRPRKDRLAVLSFDGRPQVEQPPGEALSVERLSPSRSPQHTDLSAALRLGMALFPPNTARRVVLLTDGNQTNGDVLEEVEAASAARVPVDVVPIRYQHDQEVLVERLTAPARANLGETVNLSLVVRAQQPGGARVMLYHNEQLLDLDPDPKETGYPVRLESGLNRFTFPAPLRRAATHNFRAVVRPEGLDAVSQNNEGRAFTIVGDAQRIVIVADRDGASGAANMDAARALADGLRQSRIESDIVILGETALTPSFLASCSLVVLSNISALDLSEPEQYALSSYVRDLGGGLIAMGGDNSFSVGGYNRTPLEEVLPVETERAKLQLLRLCLVIIIDRSGSMFGEKFDMAREAAIGSVRMLSSADRIGVIAFDSEAEWVVPIQPVGTKQSIIQRIAEIGMGGGTDMYPALDTAFDKLSSLETQLKHMIVLTDGQSAPADFYSLAAMMKEAGITLSTVAVGPDADQGLLSSIAKSTGGRMYAPDSARRLPQIFVRETILASRSGLFEQRFAPQLLASSGHPLLSGLAQSDIPPLDGYVVTAVKPQAQALLVRRHADGIDPILAHWQVGLGRSIAFTGGWWPRWGAEWVKWPGFSKFWAQCVRFAARPAMTDDFQVTTQIDGETGKLLLEATNAVASSASAASLVGRVVGPDNTSITLDIRQTGPGRYEASFPAPEAGTYLAGVAYSIGSGADTRTGTLQAGVSLSHSLEYAAVAHNEPLLAEIARRTGGRLLSLSAPEAVFEPWSIRTFVTRLPCWEDAVRLALIIFLIDVAVRRLSVTPMALARGVRAYFSSARPAPAAAAAATVAALRGVRDEVRAAKPDSAPPPARVVGATSDTHEDFARAMRGEAIKPAVFQPARRPADAAATRGEAGYTSRLLRAKKDAQQNAADDPPEGK